MQFSTCFCFFGCLFWLSYKVSLTLAMLFGVKERVLGIDSKKLLRPDPGLYSQYFPSYDIFSESQIFRLSYKVSLTLPMLLGVREKVLENDSQKILRPDPGLYSQYFPSYAIFCNSQIFISVQNQVENLVSENLWFTKNVITRKVLWVKTWVRSQNFLWVNL